MEATLRCLVIFLSLLLVASPRLGLADDTLSKGANITDGKTLVSSDGTFIMGFFSPGASTKRYLGIWFSGSGSTDAVVWVANRERPVTSDKAGALVVSDTGSLVVLDGSTMQAAWSSNTTSTSPAVEAQLLNSGNLVFRNRGSATILWQSFDYPTNVLLSGMKVGVDLWSRFEWHLTSWRSPDDPAPGAYRRVLDTSGLPDNVVWKGDAKTFRTGPWNGQWFSGIPEVLSYKNLIEYQMLISPREVTYGYIVKPGAPFTYVVLTETGDVNRLVWHNNSTGWQTQYHGPRDVCDNYGKCGAFGMCDAGAASTGFCSCLRGFSSASPSEWKVREASGGCQRNVRLDCGKTTTTDGFELVRGVKLPDTHNASVDVSNTIMVEECRTRCLANCSCVAYAAADIRGGGSGCIMWTENLIDLRYVDGGQDLYLRLARSEFGDPGKPTNRTLIAVPASVSAVVFLSLLVFVYLIWTGRVEWRDLICRYPALDLVTIRQATGNFSAENIIGEGAFGIVYVGTLPGLRCLGFRERTVAVKKLKPNAMHSDTIVNYFTREVRVMGKLRRHPNVLRFIANCGEGAERILVYEYMKKGSLDKYIFGKRALLSWQKRLNIIKGIARGINHMSSAKAIHRDLKPENVLLDGRWNAKVADFGTVKLLVGNAATGTRIGTPGYIAPEYVRDEAQTTLDYDVYSFGVTLLETLSGRKNIVGQDSLVSYALTLWSNGDSMGLLDAAVERPSDTSRLARKLRRCIQIGLLCVQEEPNRRPSMSLIVRMLSNTNLDVAPPVPPPAAGAGAGGALPPLLEEADTPDPTAYASVNEINLCWQVPEVLVGNEHEIELMPTPE